MTREGIAALDALRQEQGLDEKLPWGGRSPRVLTRAWNLFTLGRETTTVVEECDLGDREIDEQCRRHFHGS